jgi:titin
MATGTSLTPSYLARYLRNGRTYRFRVAAQNVAGRGPWSDVVTVRPRTTPGVPRSVSVTPGDTTFTLRWTAPSSNGGAPITAYRISISTDGATWTVLDTVDGALREYTASSLINDATVRVRIAAVNEAGAGPNSTIRSVTPTAAP